MQQILDQSDAIKEIAEVYADHNNFLYLGRGATTSRSPWRAR